MKENKNDNTLVANVYCKQHKRIPENHIWISDNLAINRYLQKNLNAFICISTRGT